MDILTKKPNLFQTVVQNMNTNYKYTTITGNLSIKDGLKLVEFGKIRPSNLSYRNLKIEIRMNSSKFVRA